LNGRKIWFEKFGPLLRERAEALSIFGAFTTEDTEETKGEESETT
jgi:hypothetical protein